MSTDFENDPDPSDWISQAEAARVQGVSRQAIHKLVQAGRLKSRVIGGHILVSRQDLGRFRPQPAGRPSTAMSKSVERLKRLLSACRPEDRQEIFRHLRGEFPIHSLESKLGIPAEVILEAIDRSSQLTVRMIRGVMAEAAFDTYVVKSLEGWRSLPFAGNPPFDFLLEQGGHEAVKVQVKLQRSARDRPLMSEEVGRKYGFASGMFVVETQRTRSGRDPATGESTRPYRFGEFDILAVAMYPSSKRWDSFRYTVADWLIPKPGSGTLLETYQPVALAPNEDWTDRFEACVSWLREGGEKSIQGRALKE